MEFRAQSISDFFDNREKFYKIPDYQRAYSWEQSNWEIFLEDLKEQIRNENEYFFGNFMLEKIDNKQFEIVDGQQRLTTLVMQVQPEVQHLCPRATIVANTKIRSNKGVAETVYSLIR